MMDFSQGLYSWMLHLFFFHYLIYHDNVKTYSIDILVSMFLLMFLHGYILTRLLLLHALSSFRIIVGPR